jgi:transposase InsO family protein
VLHAPLAGVPCSLQIFDYIESFYNPERIQKRLGYRSPADLESAAVA